jgi:hypothetical protein
LPEAPCLRRRTSTEVDEATDDIASTSGRQASIASTAARRRAVEVDEHVEERLRNGDRSMPL